MITPEPAPPCQPCQAAKVRLLGRLLPLARAGSVSCCSERTAPALSSPPVNSEGRALRESLPLTGLSPSGQGQVSEEAKVSEFWRFLRRPGPAFLPLPLHLGSSEALVLSRAVADLQLPTDKLKCVRYGSPTRKPPYQEAFPAQPIYSDTFPPP